MVHPNADPEEVKEVRLLPQSILTAMEAEMARLYRRHSSDGQRHGAGLAVHAQDNSLHRCSVGAEECRFHPGIVTASRERASKTAQQMQQQHLMHAPYGELENTAEPRCRPLEFCPDDLKCGFTTFESDVLMVNSDGATAQSRAAVLGSDICTGPKRQTPMPGSVSVSVPDIASEEAHPAPTEASVGSYGHGLGFCKPCAFFLKRGCSLGGNCPFCHLCKANERKRRKKEIKAFWRKATAPIASR